MSSSIFQRLVNCLQCKKEFIYGESAYRPFCSERCKMIDLGHWFNETYTVPVAPKTFEEESFDEFDLTEEEE